MTYELRFWNRANENIRVGGKYSHEFDSYEYAWDAANALLASAYNHGAVEASINNDLYPIEDDEEKQWEERCRDCAYLVEGEAGIWTCDNYRLPCTEVSEEKCSINPPERTRGERSE